MKNNNKYSLEYILDGIKRDQCLYTTGVKKVDNASPIDWKLEHFNAELIALIKSRATSVMMT